MAYEVQLVVAGRSLHGDGALAAAGVEAHQQHDAEQYEIECPSQGRPFQEFTER